MREDAIERRSEGAPDASGPSEEQRYRSGEKQGSNGGNVDAEGKEASGDTKGSHDQSDTSSPDSVQQDGEEPDANRSDGTSDDGARYVRIKEDEDEGTWTPDESSDGAANRQKRCRSASAGLSLLVSSTDTDITNSVIDSLERDCGDNDRAGGEDIQPDSNASTNAESEVSTNSGSSASADRGSDEDGSPSGGDSTGSKGADSAGGAGGAGKGGAGAGGGTSGGSSPPPVAFPSGPGSGGGSNPLLTCDMDNPFGNPFCPTPNPMFNILVRSDAFPALWPK